MTILATSCSFTRGLPALRDWDILHSYA